MSLRQIRVFAPAKINWHLTIERRRSDGYHDIYTIFQTVDWGDELDCHKIDHPVFRMRCNDSRVPLGEENLVARAWRRLREALPTKVAGMEMELVKRIPMQAGLGGGSSDGAAALVAIDRLFDLRLAEAELEAHAAALGSDCAFFIRGGTALGTGRGERLRPVANRLPPVRLVIVHPGFPSATAEAYRRLTPADWENGRAAEEAAAAIEAGDLERLKRWSGNIFSRIVAESDLRYAVLLDRMTREGLTDLSLSGSGSAVFGFARDAVHARLACRRLGDFYPTAVDVGLRGEGIGILSQS
ncbi:MAG: 4-(cytidine 5'-diphospho)-2-C-methyl-D-erythritol kinase [bacterium]|nr:4-(cytidine 5'-diphospho)-2-C-methyl-D-erythritol kinase [bacterium]